MFQRFREDSEVANFASLQNAVEGSGRKLGPGGVGGGGGGGGGRRRGGWLTHFSQSTEKEWIFPPLGSESSSFLQSSSWREKGSGGGSFESAEDGGGRNEDGKGRQIATSLEGRKAMAEGDGDSIADGAVVSLTLKGGLWVGVEAEGESHMNSLVFGGEWARVVSRVEKIRRCVAGVSSDPSWTC
jgi:hypothetical protein